MLETTEIGYTKKAFGVNGELKLSIEAKYVRALSEANVVFLEIHGRQVPYFIDSIRMEHDLYIKFEEVDSKEVASKLTSKKLFLRTEDAKEEEIVDTDVLFYENCVDFIIVDETLGMVGRILRIEAFPQQEMAIVDYNGKEAMIPMNDQLITEIEETAKQVKMNLPEGLLGLF